MFSITNSAVNYMSVISFLTLLELIPDIYGDHFGCDASIRSRKAVGGCNTSKNSFQFVTWNLTTGNFRLV